MNKTGTIRNIVPIGGYNSKNGYIYKFEMTVADDSGAVTGEIGSKSEQYPKQVGEEITVDAVNTQYGVRLKVVNPQYSGGGSGGGGRPPKKDVDWDKIADGKVMCNIVCAAIASNQIECKTEAHCRHWTDVIMGKRAAGVTPTQQQAYNNAAAPPPQEPMPDFDPHQDNDDISF